MRKIVLSIHTTLDGFVAGPNGEMDWIKFDEEMFDLVGKFTDEADIALYGRITYQMMDSYWPNAGNNPNATKHDIEHSRWYNKVDKIVLSKTMQAKSLTKTTFIADNILNDINKLKHQTGKNILIFGSPSAVHTLMEYNLIDDYWLFVNPVLIGQGIPLFANIKDKINLRHLSTKMFSCGVTGLNYIIDR
jgi:dihydrofolate reductase